MLGKLLKKEWALCMHPAAWIMLGLTALILIPNYPYAVSFFSCVNRLTLRHAVLNLSVRRCVNDTPFMISVLA